MEEKNKFPDGFLWGAATASYQVEGGIENTDWSEAARQEKVPVAGRATDHYNLYEKDFEIAKSLGHNAHRFSIEWARIEPEEGKFDDKEVEHYRKVLQALKDRGIEPFVTLWHFTLPDWFAKKGGFKSRKSSEIFARYCGYVTERLGDMATYWMTINEPLVYAGGSYMKGKWPPFEKNFFESLRITNRLIASHNLAYAKIKSIRPNLKIGVAKHNINFESNNPIFYPLVKFLTWFWNHRFLLGIGRHQDFIGINYYFHRKFPKNDNKSLSDLGWEIYPKGLYRVLLELKKYNKPIYITENGLADAKDEKRTKFIKDHLYWINRAIQDGIDVRGYLHWSLLDNYEWADGYWPRFGLVEVDYETLERKIRPSAYEYKKIIEANSI